MIVNNELKGICKEEAVAEFKILSLKSPEETEESHEKLGQYRRSPNRDFNPGPPEC
jgi:hypothetical protein